MQLGGTEGVFALGGCKKSSTKHSSVCNSIHEDDANARLHCLCLTTNTHYIFLICQLEWSLFGPARLSILGLCLKRMSVWSTGTITNTHNLWWTNKEPSNFSPGQGTKSDFKEWKIKESHNMKSKLALEPYNEKIGLVDITKPIIFRFFIYLSSVVVVILVKFYYLTSPIVPKLEAKSVIPELTPRDSEHCW